MKRILTNFFILFLLIIVPILKISSSSHELASWGYQLQNYDIEELKNSEYDILVIDYSKDGTDDEIFTSSEINEIRDSKNRRKILSYISIGEAEDYRFYWNPNWGQSPPEWLDEENPDWAGNYKVKYWLDSWHEVIFTYLQKILDASFDGVYLDIIDAYEYYEDTVENSDKLMIDFVSLIANFTREQDSDFLVFPQNGEEIVNERYLEIIDGIAREEVYIESTNHIRPNESVSEIEGVLDTYLQAGKTVMVVDYANKQNLIEYATSRANLKGYLSLVTDVDLDHLGPNISSESDANLNLIMLAIIPLLGILNRRKLKKQY